jgi:hypothetical protein
MNEPWNNQDASTLRAFLETAAGQKLMSKLARPARKEIKGFENVALESRFADGVDHARNEIMTAAAFNKKETTDKTSRDLATLQLPEER